MHHKSFTFPRNSSNSLHANMYNCLVLQNSLLELSVWVPISLCPPKIVCDIFYIKKKFVNILILFAHFIAWFKQDARYKNFILV